MLRVTRIATGVRNGSGSAARAWRTLRAQPGWAVQVAAVLTFLIVGLPLLLIGLVGLVVLIAAVTILALAHAVVRWFAGLLPRRDGRENVRVVTRTRTVRFDP